MLIDLIQVKGVHGEKLRTPSLSQLPVLRIKKILRIGSCKLIESHHWTLHIGKS